MPIPEENADTQLIHPDKLEVLRRLAKLSVLALAVPFVAIVIPSLGVAFFKPDENVVSALINLSWVLVIFGGFAFLVVSLFSAAVLFRVFNMHDKAHSLGLPRNSIRSLLTFLVFLILMTFIFYSTQIASTQNVDGVAEIPFSELQELEETIASLGISGAVTGYTVSSGDDGGAIASVTFLIEGESAAMEYFDRILVALLGISSTIIGFYFGSRSRESASESNDDSNSAPKQRSDEEDALPPGNADETDSLEWSVVSPVITLTKEEDGVFTGILLVNPTDAEGDREFGASFVPSERHDSDLDAAKVKVSRVANRLTLRVEGVDVTQLEGSNVQMSIFYKDEEEQAKTIPVEVKVE